MDFNNSHPDFTEGVSVSIGLTWYSQAVLIGAAIGSFTFLVGGG